MSDIDLVARATLALVWIGGVLLFVLSRKVRR